MVEFQGKLFSAGQEEISGTILVTFEVEKRYHKDIQQGWDDIQDKPLDITFEEHREKKSKSANSYAWVLINKLSGANGIPPKDIYRELIRDIEGKTELLSLPARAIPLMREAWESRGIAWMVELVDDNVDGEVQEVRLIYGSSTYNTKQMKQLLDEIIKHCDDVKIQTETPDQIARRLSLWEKDHG